MKHLFFLSLVVVCCLGSVVFNTSSFNPFDASTLTYDKKDAKHTKKLVRLESTEASGVCQFFNALDTLPEGVKFDYPLEIHDIYAHFGYFGGAKNGAMEFKARVYNEVDRSSPFLLDTAAHIEDTATGTPAEGEEYLKFTFSDSNIPTVPSPFFWVCLSVQLTGANKFAGVGLYLDRLSSTEKNPPVVIHSGWDFVYATLAENPIGSGFGVSFVRSTKELSVLGWHTAEPKCDGKYADGKTCECGCGIPDPDCYSVGPVSPSCPGDDAVCLDKTCFSTGWTKKDEFCSLKNFGSGDVCNAGCGGSTVEPDCNYGSQRKPTCALIGQVSSDKISCSENGWTCDPAAYGDGKICDCECGIEDPDCEDLSRDTTCEDNAYCYKGKCSAPRSWTPEQAGCQLWAYAAGDKVCNCGCGAFDPDCENQLFDYMYGCNAANRSDYSCSPNGTCVKATCGNGILEPYNGEECDGDAGCNSFCECSAPMGYVLNETRTYTCMPKCGDGVTVEGEECDMDIWCDNKTCTCLPGHPANNLTHNCSGCGNGILDDGEECDGGRGCDKKTCLCKSGYHAFPVYELSCYQKSDWTAVIIIAVCAGTAVLAVVVLVVWAVLSRRTKRIVAEAETRVEQNNEILRGEDSNIPVPGQIPTALLQTEVGTYDTAAGGGGDGAWGSTNMGGVGNGNGLDLSDDEDDVAAGGMGGGMTLDDDDDDGDDGAGANAAVPDAEDEGKKRKHKKHSKKKKTIRITAQPPPPGSQE